MKRILVTLLVLTLVMSLALCFGTSLAEGPKEYVVGLSMHNQTSDWAVQFKDSFLEAAEAKGCKVVWTDANTVASTQVNNIEDLVTQNIDILVVVPTDYTALGQALKAAKDAGITIVNADSKVTDEDLQFCSAFVTADSRNSGYVLGQYLIENDLLPENAIVGEITYPQVQHVTERFLGMHDYFAEAGRDDIVIVEKAATDLNAIATYTEDMLMANPTMNAIVCLNDNTALTAWATCNQLQRGDCLVIGYDGSPAAKQSIKAGEMFATMVYSPVDLATNSFNSAYSLLTDGDVDTDLKVPMWMINRENIDNYSLDKWE